MAYTVAQVITAAEAGNPIKITAVAPNTDVLIELGGRTIILSEKHATRTVDGNDNIAPKTEVVSDIRELDLGTLFTANDVLSSYSLKKAVEDVLIVADAGTIELSRQAVI